MLKKMLLATDFSPSAEQLWNSLDELKGLGMEEVIIAHIPPLMSSERSRDQAQKALEAKKVRLQSLGVEAKALVRAGFPAHEINEISVEENVDLVLIGAKGESRIRDLFLGSTVWDLLRMSKTPVLIDKVVIDNNKAVAYPLRKFSRVLLPIDFSQDSLRVCSFFINKLAVIVDEAVLVHVIDKGQAKEESAEQEREAFDLLAALCQNINDVGVKAKVRVRVGIPAAQIIKTAEEEEASLVIMAARGAGNIQELLIGSTAENVIRRFGGPVLIFPADGRK